MWMGKDLHKCGNVERYRISKAWNEAYEGELWPSIGNVDEYEFKTNSVLKGIEFSPLLKWKTSFIGK